MFCKSFTWLKSMLNDNLNLLHQSEGTNISKKLQRMARMYPAEKNLTKILSAENNMQWL